MIDFAAFDMLIQFLVSYGLIGIFVAAIISNASLFLVVPLDLIIFGVGSIYNPFLLGAVVGAGAALGEMTGYVVGLGGRAALKKLKGKDLSLMDKVNDNIEKYGMIFIAAGSFTPFPFDVIGIACGILKYDVYKFFIATFAGKFFRYTLIAYAGLIGLSFVRSFFGF